MHRWASSMYSQVKHTYEIPIGICQAQKKQSLMDIVKVIIRKRNFFGDICNSEFTVAWLCVVRKGARYINTVEGRVGKLFGHIKHPGCRTTARVQHCDTLLQLFLQWCLKVTTSTMCLLWCERLVQYMYNYDWSVYFKTACCLWRRFISLK